MAEPVTTTAAALTKAYRVYKALPPWMKKLLWLMPMMFWFMIFLIFLMIFGGVDPDDECYGDSSGGLSSISTVSGVYQKGLAPDGHNHSIAKIAYTVWQQQNGTQTELYALFMTGLVESEFKNYSNIGHYPESANIPGFPPDVDGSDHDSLGFLQQRPAAGWGRPAQIMDPAYATSKFLAAARKIKPEVYGGTGGALPTDPQQAAKIAGKLSQKVQVSAFPERYEKRWADANALLTAIGYKALDPSSITSSAVCSTAGGNYTVAGIRPMYKYGKSRAPSGYEYKIAVPAGPDGVTASMAGRAINAALDQVDKGIPYSWGGGNKDGPTRGACDERHTGCHNVGLDCSGLTFYAYSLAGLDWKWEDGGHRLAHHQYNYVKTYGRFVSAEEAAPGDLIFYTQNGDEMSHVSMYLGVYQIGNVSKRLVVETTTTGDTAKVQPLWPSSGDTRFVAYGRVVEPGAP